jgi:hypothetical protein
LLGAKHKIFPWECRAGPSRLLTLNPIAIGNCAK